MTPTQLYDDLLEMRHAGDLLKWREAEILYRIKTDRLWDKIWGTCDNFKAFCDEANIPYSTANSKVDAYKKYVIECKKTVEELRRIDFRKLHRAMPYVNRSTVDDILETARTHPFHAFLEYLKESYKDTRGETESY